VVYPGILIAFLVIVLNILGDELRDILDPSRKGNI
jgi:ABC-type dipeptide/oligopeptide/nickel transport system permease subunit